MSKIYILFMVKDSDVDCQQRKGTINPFTPHDLKEDKEQQPRLLNARENIRCSFGGIGKVLTDLLVVITFILLNLITIIFLSISSFRK